MRRIRRDETGQVVPVLALGLLTVLLGFSALVIDVGLWYQAQRRIQAAADAAALAAAQGLPSTDTWEAAELAREYARVNGTRLEQTRFETVAKANDTVSVTAVERVPSVFARVLGIDGVTIRARAEARAEPLERAERVVPFTVHVADPGLACAPRCFGSAVTLTYDPHRIPAPGAFGMLDLANSAGSVSTKELAEWVTHGYPHELPLGDYESAPGNRFASRPFADALERVIAAGRPVLLPVHASVSGNGANARYRIVGFAAFRVASFAQHGQAGTTRITGAFEQLIARGVGGGGAAYFGAKTVRLVG